MLQATILALADELASAAEPVMGKLDRIPVAIIRGLDWDRGATARAAPCFAIRLAICSDNAHERLETACGSAFVGGTGKEGVGLGCGGRKRGTRSIIGSRDAERAAAKAAELAASVPAVRSTASRNAEAAGRRGCGRARRVPADGPRDAPSPSCAGRLPRQDRGEHRGPPHLRRGRLFTPPAQGSAAEEAQEILVPEARVVASFHHIAAHELAAGDHAIECDLLLCGGDAEAKKHVTELGASMGLRAVDVGPLSPTRDRSRASPPSSPPSTAATS